MKQEMQKKIKLSANIRDFAPSLQNKLRRDQEIMVVLEQKGFSDQEIEKFFNMVPDDMPLSQIEKHSKKHLKDIMRSEGARQLVASYSKTASNLEADNPGANIYAVSGSTFCSCALVAGEGKYAFAIAAHCIADTGSNAVIIYLENGSRRVVNLERSSWSHPSFAGAPTSKYDIALLYPVDYSAYEAGIALPLCDAWASGGESIIAYGLGDYRASPAGLQAESPGELCNVASDHTLRAASMSVVGGGEDQGWNKWNNEGAYDVDTSCPKDSGGAVTKASSGCHFGVLSGVEYWVQNDLSCFFGGFCTYVQKSFWGTSATDAVRAQINANGAFFSTDTPTKAPTHMPSQSRATNAPIKSPTLMPSQSRATNTPTKSPTLMPSQSRATNAPIKPPTLMPSQSRATNAPIKPPTLMPSQSRATNTPIKSPTLMPSKSRVTNVPISEPTPISPQPTSQPIEVLEPLPTLNPMIGGNREARNMSNDLNIGAAIGIAVAAVAGLALCIGVCKRLRKMPQSLPREAQRIGSPMYAADIELGPNQESVEARPTNGAASGAVTVAVTPQTPCLELVGFAKREVKIAPQTPLSERNKPKLDLLCRVFHSLGKVSSISGNYQSFYSEHLAKYEMIAKKALEPERHQKLCEKLASGNISKIDIIQLANHAVEFRSEIQEAVPSKAHNQEMRDSLAVLQNILNLAKQEEIQSFKIDKVLNFDLGQTYSSRAEVSL
jgi:hypothetical protein